MDTIMASEKTFIQRAVEDYVDAGYATAKDDVTLVSLDGENEVVLEPLFNDPGEQIGVRIVSNDVEVADLEFNDDFADEFSKVMIGELNL